MPDETPPAGDPVAAYYKGPIGAKPKEAKGQDFQLIRCHCGLLLLQAPCAECAAPALRYSIPQRALDTRRDDGHTPILATVLCFLVVLWLGLRIDAAPDRQVDGQAQLD